MKPNSTKNGIYRSMNWLVLLVAFTLMSVAGYSQVAINNDNSFPDASAMLDIKATGLGLLAPRMTFANRPGAPATGLLIYQTDSDPGYYYYDGATWQKIGRVSDQQWMENSADIYFNTGRVAIGVNDPENNGLYVQNYTSGKAAVRGTNQNGSSIYADGMLGVLSPSSLGIPVGVTNIGVLGIKPNIGSSGAAIYGWNNDDSGFNYGGIFAADGSSNNTNYGIYVDADSASINYAGFFKGRVSVLGNNHLDGAADSAQTVFYSEVGLSGAYADPVAIQGKSTVRPGYGIAIHGQGGYRGVQGITDNTDYTGSSYAIYGSATGAGGTRYGVYGKATNTGGAAVGVYGSASGSTDSWAGYFSGDAHFSGNVGIGTLSPTASLHIKGYISVLNLQSTNNNPLVGFYDNAGTNKAYIQSWGNDFFVGNLLNGYIRFATNNINRMHIDPSGNVQIGNYTASGYRLAVDGYIICEELRVADSDDWPDYVFDKEYDLMSLKELEQSIEVNNHLPGLPSAADVKENGFLVADLQKRVLEKVEELTLYTIEQGKLIEQQGKIIEQLQDELKALRSE